MEQNKVLIEIRKVSKQFPGVRALKSVSFNIMEGEIHCIVGENGAGKSTLMKILGGVETMTSGEILVGKKSVKFNNVGEALKSGIVLISQELNIAANMKAYENIFMGNELNEHGILSIKEMKEVSNNLLRSLGAEFPVEVYAEELSVAEQQQIEIARALHYNSKILIMDEPTASLSEKETEKLFNVMKELKKKNITIIFISHRLSEVMKIADSVTVLRDGEYIGTLQKDKLEEEQIVKWMVGRTLKDYYYHKYNDKLPDKEYITFKNYSDNKKVFDVSFSAKKGEILGIAGLVGAGRTELFNLIFGINKKTSGKLFLNGKELFIKNPYNAIENGLGYIPEDRKKQGLFLELSVAFNLTINIMDTELISKYNIISKKKMIEEASRIVNLRNIKTPDSNREVKYLSGGNQQKVLLSRWLATEPDVIFLDEPTKGIDVGAKSEIYELIGELSIKGVTIIFISSELPEIIGLSQRILIMHNGKISGELTEKKDFTQENILKYAAGLK
ncbi:D-ribose transporter ATP-binding protein [Petrotoga sp. 9PW.55.5.1]|uniref:sugar ABC transporter ATP-binding protein n=1 Tax=Petrotoga sp. 9PW.55.5.1 TaxID=1308979 RepID=UPI000DC5D60E|nr:sugar ABC transporter ATP-binding protein [Petrotoga sp. 9PW.55.5.1]RAO98636.1 D-ribose transporter ATP-binding protein [Petrotoga sp. 9PW.55.5.1]